MAEPSAKITVATFDALCAEQAPFAKLYGFSTEAIGWGTARVRLPGDPAHIRPGGTIGGSALMALADFTLYAAVLSRIGPVELAVTTNLCCNFLRKPAPADVIAEARILKLGKRLAYGDVTLVSAADPDGGPVAHVTATYSIPPQP
jgi:uncharacterized protein (TIGR00369 family)